jgi:hypothetical protein
MRRPWKTKFLETCPVVNCDVSVNFILKNSFHPAQNIHDNPTFEMGMKKKVSGFTSTMRNLVCWSFGKISLRYRRSCSLKNAFTRALGLKCNLFQNTCQ